MSTVLEPVATPVEKSDPDGTPFVGAKGWPRHRVAAVLLWVSLTASWICAIGISTDRALVSAWLASGLAALSVGQPRWYRALLDWAPFILFYVAYENVRGLAYSMNAPTMWVTPIRFDEWLGNGTIPSVRLQQALLPADGATAWWEVVLGVVYMSHFYASFVLAAYFWQRNRSHFKLFIRQLVAVLGAAVLVYVLVPAAPPWAAARCSEAEVASKPSAPTCMDEEARPGEETLLGPIDPPNSGDPDHLQRLTARGFQVVPGASHVMGGAIAIGIELANPVAAVPSLHAASAALISCFLWKRVRRRWRPALAAYPLLMAFGLVWMGDHYVFDVIAGWILVAAVTVVARLMATATRVGSHVSSSQGNRCPQLVAVP